MNNDYIILSNGGNFTYFVLLLQHIKTFFLCIYLIQSIFELLQKMYKKQQLNLDFKLGQPSSRNTDRNTVEHQEPLSNTQTPAWSSVAHQENIPHCHNHKSQNKILETLTKLDGFDLSKGSYSKLKKSQHVFDPKDILINHQKENQLHQENEHFKRQSVEAPNKEYERLKSTRNRTQSRVFTNNSMMNSNISSRGNASGVIVKNERKSQQKKFKHITVHDYLYVDSKRQKNKKMLEQILDQQYKKQTILTFKPTISQKSQELAEIKYMKMSQQSQIEMELEEQLKKLEINQKISKHCPRNVQVEKQELQYRTLNRLFYVLSQERQLITKNSMKKVVEELPLVCIKQIQKIVEKVYQGKEFSWLQFLGAINDKNLVKNREALLTVTEKWMARRSKEEELTKQTARTEYFIE